MNQALTNYIKKLSHLQSKISSERIPLLDEIADYIITTKKAKKAVYLVFIGTHNSRRSHMSQIWASTLAHHFDVKDIVTYSGGTVVTAMDIRVVNALHKAGFGVLGSGGQNPRYEVVYSPETIPLVCYSKAYDSPENPTENFAAVLTCKETEEACPLLIGANALFLLHYNDPKEADDTPWEADRYEECLLQIGAEMYYLMAKVSSKPQ